jgi:alkylated DNA repair dioxygenase AlkB
MNRQYLCKEDINIPGLKYIPAYIDADYENSLIKLIDSENWILDLKRRTQHYGYKYDYKARSVNQSYYLGAMPDWVYDLCNKLYSEYIFIEKPDQVIINEYIPGQGIAAHIDCIECFADIVCSLSLGSGCIMNLTCGGVKKPIYLEAQSLCILTGDARYKWKHGIDARKSDNGLRRQRRISLTFRKVNL